MNNLLIKFIWFDFHWAKYVNFMFTPKFSYKYDFDNPKEISYFGFITLILEKSIQKLFY